MHQAAGTTIVSWPAWFSFWRGSSTWWSANMSGCLSAVWKKLHSIFFLVGFSGFYFTVPKGEALVYFPNGQCQVSLWCPRKLLPRFLVWLYEAMLAGLPLCLTRDSSHLSVWSLFQWILSRQKILQLLMSRGKTYLKFTFLAKIDVNFY